MLAYNTIMTSSSNALSFLLFLVLLVTLCEVRSLQVKSLNIPRSVKNGTQGPILLDCDFSLAPQDRKVAVRWFFKDDPTAIYVWAPDERVRRVSRMFKDHVDMNYEVSTEFYKKYRALYLRNITTRFHGKYQCQVSNSLGHSKRKQTMIVYAPAKSFKIEHFDSDQEKKAINVKCEAQGLFPKPILRLIARTEDGNKTTLDANTTIEKRTLTNDYYAKLTATINRDNPKFKGKYVNYDCNLLIAGTDYDISKTIRVTNHDSSLISENRSGKIWRKAAASKEGTSSAVRVCFVELYLLLLTLLSTAALSHTALK